MNIEHLQEMGGGLVRHGASPPPNFRTCVLLCLKKQYGASWKLKRILKGRPGGGGLHAPAPVQPRPESLPLANEETLQLGPRLDTTPARITYHTVGSRGGGVGGGSGGGCGGSPDSECSAHWSVELSVGLTPPPLPPFPRPKGPQVDGK